jgi:cytochrome b subunit of formate dehydrogenase
MLGNFKKLIILFGIPLLLLAQDNDLCISCHEDDTLTKSYRGIEVSLYVTDEHLEGSPHEGFECTECHEDLYGVEDFPHDENLELPFCGNCHEGAQEEFIDHFFEPLREKGYTTIPTCTDCHGTHSVSWEGEPRQVCGICHNDVLEDFLYSAHWGLPNEEDNLNCVSCHSPHDKDERSHYSETEWKIYITEECRVCHSQEVQNYDNSAHYRQVESGNLKAPICTDCHATHRILSPREPESIVSVAKLDMVCMNCHAGYDASVHRPIENDDPRLETCVVCHTGHQTEMKGDAVTTVFDIKLDEVCIRCHEGSLIVEEDKAHGSIHREEVAKVVMGEESNCGDCHTYHYMAPDHEHDRALEKSCADCHREQQEQYENSSHYVTRARGHLEAPGCVDCHDEKRIGKADEEFVGHSVIELCSRCHGDRDLTMRFQLNQDVVEGYETSYHGQMYQLGYQGEKFATCVSCHDNHSILPSDNPESTVGMENIINTCAQCHDNVNANFVQFLQHYTPHTKSENKVLGWINTFMLWLLGSVLTVFGTHTILWLIRLMIRRIKHGPIKKTVKTKMRVERFAVFERLLHFLMAFSFLILAGTGLPLKYAHSEMATWMVHNLIGFEKAAFLHRTAAFTMGIVFLSHLIKILYKAFIKKQKGIFKGQNSLVPRWQDVKDFFNHMAYFIGIKKEEPAWGRWTYWEKFDYLAVVWGMLIIGSSGLTLWFPERFSQLFPGWIINAAHIIHSEEALLATGFIFVVHFFNTHLRPGAFPMDEVIFTGRIPEGKFEEERSLELKELSKEDYNSRLVSPLPKWIKIFYFIIGYTFLTLGMILLVLIILGSFG